MKNKMWVSKQFNFDLHQIGSVAFWKKLFVRPNHLFANYGSFLDLKGVNVFNSAEQAFKSNIDTKNCIICYRYDLRYDECPIDVRIFKDGVDITKYLNFV